jgi:hypothetical protein
MSSPAYFWDVLRYLPLPSTALAAEARWTAVENQDGHLEVFALAQDGAVWHTWQSRTNVVDWSDWASLGTPGAITQLALPIRSLQNQDGRVEIFILDDNYKVWHIWQAAPNVNWVAQWASLGTPPSSTTVNPSFTMAVCLTDTGAISVFMQDDSSGDIFSRSQKAANGSTGWEESWTSVGSVGGFEDFAVAASPKSLQTQAVAVLPFSNDFWVTSKSGFIAGQAAWSAWSFGFAPPPGIAGFGNLVLQPNQDGRLELFAFDSGNSNLWHTWQNDKFQWTGEWSNLSHPSTGIDGAFVTSLDPSGVIDVVACGDNFILGLVSQTAPNGGWGAWGFVGSNREPHLYIEPELAAVRNDLGLLNIFVRTAGDVGLIRQLEPGHRS